jgi:DNA-binding NarL/FixJ family response regulator
MIRVVVADDHTIVREGLKQLLAATDDLQVAGEARDGHEVLKIVREIDFDVLLLDLSMPSKSGMELIKQVKSEKPRLRILVLSKVAEQLALSAMPHAEGLPHTSLSDREFQVFRLLVSGESVSDIAERLSLSVKTVSTHKARLMEKMGLANQTELIHYAIKHKLVDDSDTPA